MTSPDGPIEYRASELGGCLRYLVLKRLGYTPMPTPQQFQETVFDRGQQIEDEVVAWLGERGWQITAQQQETRLAITDKIMLTGHIDGLVVSDEFGGPSALRVLEIKSTDRRGYDDFRRQGFLAAGGFFPRYRWQVSAYMHSVAKEAVIVVREKDSGETTWQVIETPPYSLADIRARILTVEAAVVNSDTQTDCTLNYPCAFYYMHDQEPLEEDEEIEALALAYQDAKARERIAKESVAKIRTSILGSLADRKTVRTRAVTVTSYQGSRKGFDRGRAEAELGVDLTPFETTTTFDGLRVTVREDVDAAIQDRDNKPNEG